MMITLLGINTLVIEVLPLNALSPITTTGSLPIFDGMSTTPPVPV